MGDPLGCSCIPINKTVRAERGAQSEQYRATVEPIPGCNITLNGKASFVHGILQFTPSIAFLYVLHQCEIRDIRCRESFSRDPAIEDDNTARTLFLGQQGCALSFKFLGTFRACAHLYTTKGSVALTQCSRDKGTRIRSPMKTLLQFLLPPNDKVQWTSCSVAGNEPPTSLQFEHFTGPFNWLERQTMCTKGRDVVS
ncbi:unnamed protein product [Prunus armeniaca]